MAFRIGPPPKPSPQFKKPASTAGAPEGEMFDELLPCSFRDIHFPVSSVKVTLAHDLVQHKYWGKDGARVENTGRAPLEIECTIPFVNGIVSAKNEQWSVLYPDTFRQFLQAFAARKWGIFVHPEFDQIPCKAVSMEFDHDAMTRDGVEVTARWVETNLENDDGLIQAFGNSPIKTAQLAALGLDASKTDLLALVPEAEQNDFTFDDLVDKATGFVDQVNLTASLLAAKPGQMVARVQRLGNAIDRLQGTGNALAWKMRENSEKLEDASRAIFQGGTKTSFKSGRAVISAVPPSRKIGRWTTGRVMSFSQIQAAIAVDRGVNVSVEDLCSLNPSLINRPQVSSGVVIRYYEN